MPSAFFGFTAACETPYVLKPSAVVPVTCSSVLQSRSATRWSVNSGFEPPLSRAGSSGVRRCHGTTLVTFTLPICRRKRSPLPIVVSQSMYSAKPTSLAGELQQPPAPSQQSAPTEAGRHMSLPAASLILAGSGARPSCAAAACSASYSSPCAFMKKACVHSFVSIAAAVVASLPEWASTAPLGRLQTLYTAGHCFSFCRSIPVQPPLMAASVRKISVMYDGPTNSHRASAGTASSLAELAGMFTLLAAMAGHATSTDRAVQRN